MAIYNAAWAIPLLPLLGALASLGAESQRRAAQLCVAFSGLSFVVAAVVVWFSPKMKPFASPMAAGGH